MTWKRVNESTGMHNKSHLVKKTDEIYNIFSRLQWSPKLPKSGRISKLHRLSMWNNPMRGQSGLVLYNCLRSIQLPQPFALAYSRALVYRLWRMAANQNIAQIPVRF